MLAEGFEEIDSSGYPTVVQRNFGMKKPEIMALGHKKGVSISWNSWEGEVNLRKPSSMPCINILLCLVYRFAHLILVIAFIF